MLCETAAAGGHIVLTGGSTPKLAYETASRGDVDWSRATVWFSDERCVPPEHGLSNFRMANDSLIGRLNKDSRPVVMRMEGEFGPEAGSASYEADVRERMGGDPRWDLLLLGLGPGRAHRVAVPEQAGVGGAAPARGRRGARGHGAAGAADLAHAAGVERARGASCSSSPARTRRGAMARAFGSDPDAVLARRARAPAGGRAARGVRRGGGQGARMSSDQFMGVDVGGTKIAVAVLEGGELSESRIVSTEQASQDALVEQIATAIEGSMTPSIRAVGIGMPSIIEFATGKILSCVNIPLHDIPLRDVLTTRMGVPVYVENDAGCAALAEAFEGGRITVPSLVMLTIGTGVGGGWVLNGRLYRGATTSAAEVGHTIIGRDLEWGNRVPGRPVPAARLAWRRWGRAARWTGWPTTRRGSTATPISAG